MKTFLSVFLIMAASISTSAQNPELVRNAVARHLLASVDLCKHLHQFPELSLQEFETSKLMAQELSKLGFEVTEKFGGNNVVGIFRNGKGPVAFLRTDMDALPVEEKTGFKFASKVKTRDEVGNLVPVMHACGHDIHMSVWLGSLRTLVAIKDQWKGTLLVIAQQAEEVSKGSSEAINAGLFVKYPVPDFAYSFHINPELEAGQIGLVEGPVFAGVETVNITVFGKGGHGAYPEKCIDPVVIASRIVLDLQTIVSREISPLDPVVVTVGSIHGGTRPNIIPDEVKMELTLRYYSKETITKVISAIRRISRAAALAAGMPEENLPLIEVLDASTPPVINEPGLVQKTIAFTSAVIGRENIVKTPPAMVGEDFGKYGWTAEKIPVCLMWLGSTNAGLLKVLKANNEAPHPLHSPFLYPDFEKTIETGMQVMVANVLGHLKNE